VLAGGAGALARPGGGGRGQPHPGAGPDPRWHLLRRRRLHHPAAQRHRLRGRPGPQRRPGVRAGPVRRPGDGGRPGGRGGATRRTWAATIDYTPDHQPIIGPALGPDGPLAGVTVASAGGHGMMWGPAVARVAADLALTGTSEAVDAAPLGLDRFDEEGRSRLAT